MTTKQVKIGRKIYEVTRESDVIIPSYGLNYKSFVLHSGKSIRVMTLENGVYSLSNPTVNNGVKQTVYPEFL